jgi:hypothetical protein
MNEHDIEFSELAAWGLLVGALVYASGLQRLTPRGAAALAVAAGLGVKLFLLSQLA